MTSLAFEIGFDHYRFGLPLEINRFSETHRKQLRQGYEAAKYHSVTIKKPDIFDKKLLGIRDRALIKGLEVSLTSHNLKTKLIEAGDSCPIILKPFTFAEHDATDWSVDRIDNTQGYHLDNIVIISRLANTAKSDLDLPGILKKSLAQNFDKELLTSSEWIRLARFYYHKTKMTRHLSFCRILAESEVIYDQILFLQLFKNQDRHAKVFLKHLEKYSGKDCVQKAKKLTEKRAYQKATLDVDVLYTSPKLYQWVQGFKKAISSHSSEFDGLLMDCMYA
jgi:hypothetical protein